MIQTHLFDHIHHTIQNARKVLITTHEDPDIDAVGSACAFSRYLTILEKPHMLFFKDFQNNALRNFFLSLTHYSSAADVFKESYDLIAIFDAGDLKHTGVEDILEEKKSKTVILNIDHHPTNTHFGTFNIVDTQAVSTTEILFDFFIHRHIHISREISEYLLAGILGDTNNFTNYNTTPRSLEIASYLLQKGASPRKIREIIKRKKSNEALNIWGKIFSRLRINHTYNIAYTIIAKEDIGDIGGKTETYNGFSNYLNIVSGVKFSLVIKENNENTLKISMRSNDDLIDLAKFAKIFNGGGHKKAAGFSIYGKLEKTDRGWRIL